MIFQKCKISQPVRRQHSLVTPPNLPTFKGNIPRYEGPTLDELLRVRKSRVSSALYTIYSKPLALHAGRKQWLFDLDGKRYLDMFGGICTVSVGHCHERVTDAVAKQMATLGHISNVYIHPKIQEYALRLTDKFPADLKVVYFVNSGSEANDLASLMARVYTKKTEIVTLQNCYHGMTSHLIMLNSLSDCKYALASGVGSHNVTMPDIYRGNWGGSHCRDSPVQTKRKCSCAVGECEAKDKYVKEFDNLFKYNIHPQRLAAFFAESIQGVGGIIQYPRGYLKEIHKIVKEHEGVYIADEIQTGFGRTGEHFWGFQMHDVVPDIVTLAKGIGNGFPLAAVVTTKEISDALQKASYFNTFGGNPLACAAGIAVLDVIEEEQLQKNCKELGTYLLLELQKLQDDFPIAGDVRGKGLMIGVELVEGDGTTEPLNSVLRMKLWEFCRNAGLLIGMGGRFTNVIRIKPPMCITKEDADFTVQVLRSALEIISH